MRARQFGGWALAIWALTLPAAAQETGPTRAEAARAVRDAKAAGTAPYAPGRVERVLDFVETSRTVRRILAPTQGWGIRIGGIENGSGLATGPSWRSRRFDGNLEATASGVAAISGDREVAAGLTIPQLGSHRLSAEVTASSTHLAGERFFGLGHDTRRDEETAFHLDQRSVRAGVSLDAASWLRVSGGAALLDADSGDGRRRGVPGIGMRFDSGNTPGLADPATLRVVSLAATVDTRDVPGNPRGGGRYHLGVARYVDTARDRYSFTRIDAEFEQHLSAWRRQRVLTLRAVASSAIADEGHDVPFYLQPSLGGSRLLRGFVTDRFRDTTLVALQAEYGFDLLPFVSAVAFYEAGAVAPRWQALSLGNLRRDYGLGFRFGGARAVAFRTDVAFGSGEGTRLTMRFNHAF